MATRTANRVVIGSIRARVHMLFQRAMVMHVASGRTALVQEQQYKTIIQITFLKRNINLVGVDTNIYFLVRMYILDLQQYLNQDMSEEVQLIWMSRRTGHNKLSPTQVRRVVLKLEYV